MSLINKRKKFGGKEKPDKRETRTKSSSQQDIQGKQSKSNFAVTLVGHSPSPTAHEDPMECNMCKKNRQHQPH